MIDSSFTRRPTSRGSDVCRLRLSRRSRCLASRRLARSSRTVIYIDRRRGFSFYYTCCGAPFSHARFSSLNFVYASPFHSLTAESPPRRRQICFTPIGTALFPERAHKSQMAPFAIRLEGTFTRCRVTSSEHREVGAPRPQSDGLRAEPRYRWKRRRLV